jgi:hypothetical protein
VRCFLKLPMLEGRGVRVFVGRAVDLEGGVVSLSVSVSRSVSVADSPSVWAGVESSAGSRVGHGVSSAIEATSWRPGASSLWTASDVRDRGMSGIRCARSFLWPYVLSISKTYQRSRHSSGTDGLTWILKKLQKSKLSRMSNKADEQDGITAHDERETVITRISD